MLHPKFQASQNIDDEGPIFQSQEQPGVTGCKVWGILWLWHEGDLLFYQELLH
jgi:hypothetical protein